MWSERDLCNDSGVLPVNDDNLVGNWTNTTMNLTKTPKRIRNSTEDEEVNIESETSEGSDFLQCRQRLNKKARRAKVKLCSKTQTEKSKEIGKSRSETEIAKEKTNEKQKPAPAGQPFFRQGNQPPPTFLQHPVVLEDLGTGVASFLDNGPRTASLFQQTIGPILLQRPLLSGKFLIGCRSRQQQEALLKTKVLSGVNVAYSIPQPITEGVIRPVPTNIDCQFLVDHSAIKEVHHLTNQDSTQSQAIKITFPVALNWTTRSSWCMSMCHRSGDAPRAISWATLKHNAGAQCRCAHAAAVGATHLTCVPTNFAASTAAALTQQPTKAAHNNVCALSQTESGLRLLFHTQKP